MDELTDNFSGPNRLRIVTQVKREIRKNKRVSIDYFELQLGFSRAHGTLKMELLTPTSGEKLVIGAEIQLVTSFLDFIGKQRIETVPGRTSNSS